jgi:two-component system, cell cycle sensor histidine kinase and response regulator CckA
MKTIRGKVDAAETKRMRRKSIATLLLVEDNPGDARLLREMFEEGSRDTEVTHVESMREAEKYLAQHAVNVVVLDLGLPDTEGLETVRRARAAAPCIPLVVLTSLDDEPLALQALQKGAQDYLVKGQIDTRTLLRALRYAVERKNCEEALIAERKRSEEGWARLAAIHEATPDLVSISDPEGRLLYVNRGGRRMLGLDEEADITGYTIADFLPDAASHVIPTEGIPTAVRDGVWSGEAELVSLAGRTISISQIILAHKRPDGSVEFLSCIARDISEHKRIDEALRASEARHRRLLESNIIGVAFWNTSGDILNANDLFLKMIGYSREDLQRGSLRWIDLTPPEYAPTDAKALAELTATGTCAAFEKEFIRKDGSRVTVLVGSALLEGQSDTGSSFVMDITERKQAEARLHLQSAALNAAGNAIVITERDGTIVWINPSYTELTGYTDGEAIGRNQRDLVRSGVHDQVFYKDMWDTILEGGSWSGEVTNRRKDGRLYSETQVITPVKDDDGTITHFISINTDLTAQRQMEAQLRQAQKMEAVGQLAAGVAHEFNNLLQALMSRAAIVRLRAGTPDVEKIGADMEVQIKRGASITQQLLLFSRSHATQKSNLDLRQKVLKASVLLRQLIPENIRIVVDNPAERLSIDGDAGQMQQVLLNLAINARDAMPAGGTLTLRAGSCGSEVFLEVEDTGHGVDETTLARIFEPFFTTKEVGKGSGLGLAVVHGIVQQHSGRIEVHSRPGEGARFRVIFPVASTEVVPTRESGEDAEVPMGSGRVLLVEDEVSVRTGIEGLLEMIGYEVTAVGSGEEAIAISLEAAPDLLLSDVTLPGIAGLALGERLLERWPSMKVVLMSGYIEERLRANAAEQGWHFLQKPFELADLASHLRAALDGKLPGTIRFPTRPRSASTHEGALLVPVADLATIRPAVA